MHFLVRIKRDPKQGVKANLTENVLGALWGVSNSNRFLRQPRGQVHISAGSFFLKEVNSHFIAFIAFKDPCTSVVDDKTIYEIMWDLEGSHIMSWNLDEKSEKGKQFAGIT